MKIVSLVPSQTELLYDLGLENEVIGITKFCVRPKEWFSSKTKIGGTKNLNLKKIKELKPDLIIANKEENVRGQIEELQREYEVYVSDVKNLDDALRMIAAIGDLTSKKKEAQKIIVAISRSFENFKSKILYSKTKIPNILYLVWKNPYMSIGNDTFIHDMITHCGYNNVFGDLIRYPSITIKQIKNTQPDFIFLSSEPYPFKEKDFGELKTNCPAAKIILVNGEYFSWYGSRLIQAPGYFQKLMEQIQFC